MATASYAGRVRVMVAMSGRSRLLGGRGSWPKTGPRRRRRDPEALGRRLGFRMLLGRRRGGRAARRRAARSGSPHLRPPPNSNERRWPLRRRPRRRAGPEPCVECNRHIKFGRLLERAMRLGFDDLATGHHARVARRRGARLWRCAGVDERRTSRTCCRCSPSTSSRSWCSPSGS